MKEHTFERDGTNNLQEGDYVFLKLNKKFIIKQLEEKEKMKQQAQEASQKGGKKGQMAPAAPAQGGVTIGLPPVDPPSFVIGKVSECLMSLIFLIDAFEEKSKGPIKKGYEHREIKEIRKITQEQYESTKKLMLGSQ